MEQEYTYLMWYFEHVLGYCPQETVWLPTRSAIRYMLDNGLSGEEITAELKKHKAESIHPNDLTESLWNKSLLQKGHFYFHKTLQISSPAPLLKKDGSVMIIGLTTDFTKLDLKRIASQLTDIRVYFGTTVTTPIVQDNEICVLLGRVRREEQVLYPYVNLLDIFVNHISSEDVFELYGSDENTVIPYSSYDITTQDFLELLPAIRQTTDKLVNTLIPKNDDTARRPLLPFSSGQLGLILISGEINGAIREANGCCHVVKGSSKQRTDTKTEETRNEEGVLTHIKETQSVYSSTNVTTIIPSGEIKVLC